MRETTPSSPAQEVLEACERLLAERAARLGLAFEARHGFAGQLFCGGDDTPSARIESSDLPNHVRGYQVGRYAVLLTLLAEAPDQAGIGEVVRRVRNQCVVARSFLAPAAALDLNAIMIGPRGSEGDDRWKALALVAERDERVARKFVWLRPNNPSADEQSFEDFTKRSFLARPWRTNAIFSMASLDNVSRALAFEGLPPDTAREWIELASAPGTEPDVLVEQLVASWKRQKTS